jgi:hypothetical protein
MRNFIKYILFIPLFLVSCSEDFTNLAPISQRNVENFYKTAGDMEVAVNAIYSVLQRSGAYNEAYWILMEMRSDNTDNGPDVTGLARERTVIDNFEENSTNEIITNAFIDSYLGISRANIVLERIDDVEMDATLRERLRGEALFLRSLFYYHLAVAYGNIPLVLIETKSVGEGRNQQQVPAGMIYNQVIQDLDQAVKNLPASVSGDDTGRATSGAAATLLAKVYLTIGDNSTAEGVLRDIISSQQYELLDNYSDLWGVENEHNAESIFEVEFQGGGFGGGNRFTNDFSPLPALQTSVGAYRNRPTRDMLAAYEPGDGRFFASMDTSYVDDSGMVLTNTDNDVRFVVKYGRDNPFQEGDAPNNWIVFRYADVLLMLAEALGESPEAYDRINEVRARAGLDPIDGNTPGSFAEKLLHERRVELAFENHRWADLKRFGVAEAVMQAHGKEPNLLFPIPQRELDLNPGFAQNPGY